MNKKKRQITGEISVYLVIEAVSGCLHSFVSPTKSVSQSCFCQGVNDFFFFLKELGICHCPGDKTTRKPHVANKNCRKSLVTDH